MSDWSNNNRAHTQTWYVLRVMDQNSLGFQESRDVTMDQLTFWAASASDEVREQQTKTLATQMDNIFRMILGAKYEPGVSQDGAVHDIEAALADASRTISELAAVNDANYAFLGEPTND